MGGLSGDMPKRPTGPMNLFEKKNEKKRVAPEIHGNLMLRSFSKEDIYHPCSANHGNFSMLRMKRTETRNAKQNDITKIVSPLDWWCR